MSLKDGDVIFTTEANMTNILVTQSFGDSCTWCEKFIPENELCGRYTFSDSDEIENIVLCLICLGERQA